MKNLKRILSAALVCVLAVCCVGATAFADEPTQTSFALQGSDEYHTIPEWAVIGINQARANFGKDALGTAEDANTLAQEYVKCDIAYDQGTMTTDEVNAKIDEAVKANVTGVYDGKHVTAVSFVSYRFDSGNGTLYPLDWSWLTEEDEPVASDAQIIGTYFEHYNGTWYNTLVFFTIE